MHFSHPEWSYDTNIYEVNVRQYTHEGTFNSFQNHLPRLRQMGVEVLWFMPVTPISIEGRKGSLGSYYAVQNYTAVNSEFGTLQNFIDLVQEAHKMGFKVIIDWVANHTGNDNIWVKNHPEFYCYDESNQIIHPHGWEDVSKLNFDNSDMQSAMIKAMQFWIKTCDIDGFRCDMAHLVPLEFWRKARTELQSIKADQFWLAECEESNYHEVFDATYTWKWMHATEEFCRGQINLSGLASILFEYNSSFTHDAFRIYFTSNHDENSWNGTEYEKYGNAARALALFACTWNGMPMIYSGQELPNNKRLHFFDKDEIEWKEPSRLHTFYKILLELRKRNAALRAADENVITFKIESNNDDKIFCFLRTNGNDEVLVLLNLSREPVAVHLISDRLPERAINIFTKEVMHFTEKQNIELAPWDYRVYEKEKLS